VRNLFLILGFAAMSLVLGVLLWSFQQSNKAQSQLPGAQAATVLPQPREVPAFSLTDHNGQAFGHTQLQGRWSLLFFGFTRCPDICPNTLGLLHAVSGALKKDGKADNLQVVFVSVDPKHDNTATLKSYVEYFDPGFVAVTGSEPELRTLTDALYVPYTYVPTGKGDDYTVEHSGALVLLNPQGQAMAYFSPPLKVDPIVNDLRELVKS
jgi:protein SCO1